MQPEFVGFVFVPGSKRYVSTRQAKRLKALLSPRIQAVGVFANAEPETVAGLLDRGVIDLAQLHGGESGDYIRRLRRSPESHYSGISHHIRPGCDAG